MCKTKMSVKAAEPDPIPRTPSSRPVKQQPTTSTSSSSSSAASYPSTSTHITTSSSSSLSSRNSLSSLRHSLPENPHIYDFSEITAATNNFLSKKFSSSSASSWRCTLRSKDVIVFQRKFRQKLRRDELRSRLSIICRNHHNSIVKLLGASTSGDYIYLVYDFIDGANLADCLRNSRNPNFTVLKSWVSRMQIATDLAHGLDYIHNNTGLNMCLVHNHIKSSSVLVTEPSFNAKICHFGTAQLCGETDENEYYGLRKGEINTIEEIIETKELKRSNSGKMQFDGVRGYLAPEYGSSGVASQKADVYAFGVVILELLSGEEPMKYKFDKGSGDFVRTSVIETAREAVDGKIRQWVDRRMGDSFPVDVAEMVIRIALECVDDEPEKRPAMGRVAGKISKLYMKSKAWSNAIKVPTAISISLNPR